MQDFKIVPSRLTAPRPCRSGSGCHGAPRSQACACATASIHTMFGRSAQPATNQPSAAQRLSSASANGLLYASRVLLRAPNRHPPRARRRYRQCPGDTRVPHGATRANTAHGILAPCGYSPARVPSFHGFDQTCGLDTRAPARPSCCPAPAACMPRASTAQGYRLGLPN